VTVIQAELWKLGQLAPGDTVRFRLMDPEEAEALRDAQDRHTLRRAGAPPVGACWKGCARPIQQAPTERRPPPIIDMLEANGETVCLRRAGDDYLLVESGPPQLDLTLRFQVHVLMERLQELAPAGLIDLTPGIRSLQIHVDSACSAARASARDVLGEALDELPAVDDIEVPARIVHLPLSWDDAATQLAIRKYQELVRPDAPWCPSNIEFIRRINGLADEDAVRAVVFDAHYLVLGLGDVYLGAPVATPVDPRHRLVTTKYNPARTWTPENAVGIGGAYLCIYGMEGPGGYQFVGRTVQVWNTWRSTANFTAGQPWLLRFFDQIRFFPVSAAELAAAREAFPYGAYTVRTEDSVFRLADIAASSPATPTRSPSSNRAAPPSPSSASAGATSPRHLRERGSRAPPADDASAGHVAVGVDPRQRGGSSSSRRSRARGQVVVLLSR
jgi:urea carboxylase